MPERIFSYEEACNLLEPVRKTTQAASERLEQLREQARHATPEQAAQVKAWIDTVVNQWAQDILALGALPKGLFTVDFDSGEGFYYCWQLNEAQLGHYHTYDEGFGGRKPLDRLRAGQPVLN